MCLQVGPGVKGLAENDWVVPLKPNLGTWRSLAGARRGGWECMGRVHGRGWLLHACLSTHDQGTLTRIMLGMEPSTHPAC